MLRKQRNQVMKIFYTKIGRWIGFRMCVFNNEENFFYWKEPRWWKNIKDHSFAQVCPSANCNSTASAWLRQAERKLRDSCSPEERDCPAGVHSPDTRWRADPPTLCSQHSLRKQVLINYHTEALLSSSISVPEAAPHLTQAHCLRTMQK